VQEKVFVASACVITAQVQNFLPAILHLMPKKHTTVQ
jgi:hypothetical protein